MYPQNQWNAAECKGTSFFTTVILISDLRRLGAGFSGTAKDSGRTTVLMSQTQQSSSSSCPFHSTGIISASVSL